MGSLPAPLPWSRRRSSHSHGGMVVAAMHSEAVLRGAVATGFCYAPTKYSAKQE